MHGSFGQLGNVAEENADRALADFRDAGLEQPVDHRRQPIVVETFPALNVVMDVENFVGGFEFLHRKRDAFIPDAQVFLVAGLQLDEFVAAGLAHRLVALAQVVGRFVNPDQLGDRVARQRVAIEQMFPAVNHHPELRAPVADVVVANDVVPKKTRDPGERVAQDQCCGYARRASAWRRSATRNRSRCGGAFPRAGRRGGRPAKARIVFAATASGLREKLIKPAPAIVGGSHHSPTSRCSMIFCASVRGFSPRCFARTSAAFVW